MAVRLDRPAAHLDRPAVRLDRPAVRLGRLADRLGRLADRPGHLAVDLSSVFPPVNRRIVVDVKLQPPIYDSVPNRGLNFMHVYCLRKHEDYRKEQLFIRVVVPMTMTTPTFLLPTPASAHDQIPK
jgi:hypothetical protein